MSKRIIAGAFAVVALTLSAAGSCDPVTNALPGGSITGKTKGPGPLVTVHTVRGDVTTDRGKAAKCTVGEIWPKCWLGAKK